MTSGLQPLLDARSVAVVGASARPGSFGHRMVTEVLRGAADRRVELINPRYREIDGRPCRPSLDDLDDPPDLVLLGVNDDELGAQFAAAARIGAGAAVLFGGAHRPGLRDAIRDEAASAGMAVCGAGCMGLINVTSGLRAIGYAEPAQIPIGPISLITHSGSVFSTMLRTRRALGYRFAISSGQELVTTTADYVEYLLERTDTSVIALFLETVRDGARLRAALRRAADRDVAVVALPVGGSPLGAALVTAHSGAVAGAGAMWEALCADTGVRRVADLAELTDTLELFALARRTQPRRTRPRATGGAAGGLATVHDSGAERTLVADLADELGVGFARLDASTRFRLAALLDDGLEATNPLDVWGTGVGARDLFAQCLLAMRRDPGVAVTALAVDLVTEFDGDTSYEDALTDAHAAADPSAGPLVVLANLAGAIDADVAARLRAHGIPVLEGTRSGLVALRHWLSGPPAIVEHETAAVDATRQARWRVRLAGGTGLSGAESFALLHDYGIAATPVHAASDAAGVRDAAAQLGYPVVLKTDEPGIAHKTDVGGVVTGVADAAALDAAYADLAARLGSRVLVCATASAGIEVSIGLVRDPQVGPLLVLAAGGVLLELLADRVVALPPISSVQAGELIRRLRSYPLLTGWRGAPAADIGALAATVAAVAQLALELGDCLDALDVNPVFVRPDGVTAVDVLVVPRRHDADTDAQKIE